MKENPKSVWDTNVTRMKENPKKMHEILTGQRDNSKSENIKSVRDKYVTI